MKKSTILTSVIALCASGALAQEVSDQGEETAVLGTVTVTAQKRAENLQEVPLSVTAISGESLERAGIADVTDLDKRIVGVVVDEEKVSRPYIYIRGVGTRSFDIGSEGSVGVFVDGVYVPRFSSVVSDLLAIERMEVLKGPQGTLYGRNTIGGAISVVTKDPADTLEGEVRVRAGNYGEFGANGLITGPIADGVAFNLAAGFSEIDGPQTETITGRAGTTESSAIRGRLRFEPTAALTVDLIADYSDTDVDAYVSEFVPNPNLPAGAPPALIAGPQVAPVIGGILADGTSDLFSQALDVSGGIAREASSFTLKAEWDGAPFTVTSITGIQNEELYERLDFDGTVLDLVDQTVQQESNAFSQELRLTSTPGGFATFSDRFEWLLGAYYYNDDAERSDDYPSGVDSIIGFLATGGMPPFIRSPNLYQVDLDTESYALFGQGTVDLTDRLSLTLGLRYTEDQKDFIYDASSPTPGLPPIVADFTIDDGDTFKSTDPRVTLDYQVTDDVLIYGTYAQGFKSGGVQYANAVPSLASQIFQPETLKSYEAGVKSRLFDGRVQANAAAFFYDYEDQQILNIITIGGLPTGFTENAGSSELRGFDLDVQAALTTDLMAVFSYGYLDSEFVSFDSISGADLTGNRLPRAPEHSIKAGLNYVHSLGDLGDLVLDGHYSWTDEYFFDAENTPYAVQDSFSVVDLSAALEFQNGLTARVFCSNCGDEDIFTSFTVFSDASGAIAALDYQQRYGIELKKTF